MQKVIKNKERERKNGNIEPSSGSTIGKTILTWFDDSHLKAQKWTAMHIC